MSPRAHSPATYSKCGVSPRITQPSAITAWYSPLAANLSAASGSSNAPGTRCTFSWSSAPPCARQARVAPSINCETRPSLKRAATMATRQGLASKLDSVVWDPVMGAGVYLGHVAGDFQPEGGDTLQLFGRGQHLHARDAEVLEDLRADAVGAQHLRSHGRIRGMLDALPERAH